MPKGETPRQKRTTDKAPPESTVKTRKRKPRSPNVKESDKERERRLLVEAQRKPLTPRQRSWYDRASYFRADDLLGLALAEYGELVHMAILKRERRKVDGETVVEDVINTRLLALRRHVRREIRETYTLAAQESIERPNKIVVEVVLPSTVADAEPDVPVYFDDKAEAERLAGERAERQGQS